MFEEDKLRYKQKLIVTADNNTVQLADSFCDVSDTDWKFDLQLYTWTDLENYRYLDAFDFVLSNTVGPIGQVNVQKLQLTCVLRAEVAHSQSVTAAPLNVWLRVTNCGTIEVAHCTCMEGLY